MPGPAGAPPPGSSAPTGGYAYGPGGAGWSAPGWSASGGPGSGWSAPPPSGPPYGTQPGWGGPAGGYGPRAGFGGFARSRAAQLIVAGLVGAIVGGGVVAAVAGAWDRANTRRVVFDEGGPRGRFPLDRGPYRIPGPGPGGNCQRTDTGFRCDFTQPTPAPPSAAPTPVPTS
ncbi:hypothetical protein J5X84_00340 [Streptosporangiaceae bacterium NEAU-GS5]|nr:hypothetical protein [Streptosporangiaceae bacterium NEAU-GS5]